MSNTKQEKASIKGRRIYVVIDISKEQLNMLIDYVEDGVSACQQLSTSFEAWGYFDSQKRFIARGDKFKQILSKLKESK